MLVLGIETSRQPGSVALCRDNDCLAEIPLDRDGLRHAQALPLTVASLLADHSLTTNDVDLIAISQGPGSFTGLRVGIAFAKTLAWASGCQLVAVDTFAAIAANAPVESDSLWIAADAHRNELFVRLYHRQSDRQWTPAGDHSIVVATQWCGDRRPGDTVVAASPELLDGHLSNPVTCEPVADSVARLGQLAARAGHFSDPVTLEPLYLRRSAAEEKRDSNPDSPGKNQLGDSSG